MARPRVEGLASHIWPSSQAHHAFLDIPRVSHGLRVWSFKPQAHSATALGFRCTQSG